MHILAISGSASEKSTNTALLHAISNAFNAEFQIEVYNNLRNLPLFTPESLKKPLKKQVSELKDKILAADALLICTPEYTHNIPAVLKNAIEWMTASGEFSEKKVLAVTFTPKQPRGEWAMQSLIFSLKTLNTRIVAQLHLYHEGVEMKNEKLLLNDAYHDILKEAFQLFKT